MEEENHNQKRPEWAPAEAARAFATQVLEGVEGGHDGSRGSATRPPSTSGPRRRRLSIDDYVQGVLAADRVILGRTITLMESNAPAHQEQAQEVLQQLLPHTGRSLRVGVTGVPGAGKSTFVDTLGSRLCDSGHKVAVLAIDPSSTRTRGSILGDKTRMEQLSGYPGAFIRPSPTGGTLGGVTRKSRETLLVCEAAGFDVVLVETVGVGQSEVAVRGMVDFFLLMLIAGAGDELQGLKRGIMELCDTVAINKADGDNRRPAELARADLERIIHYLQPATEGWTTRVMTCSARTGAGVDQLWQTVEEFQEKTLASGVLEARRKTQLVDWLHVMTREYLERRFYGHPRVKSSLPEIEASVLAGELSATQAVRELVDRYERQG